jgi:Mg2+-importing ATPase
MCRKATRRLDAPRQQLLASASAFNQDGFRVLVVATREIPPAERKAQYTPRRARPGDPGFLTFLDPPKETAGPAIAALRDMGVR